MSWARLGAGAFVFGVGSFEGGGLRRGLGRDHPKVLGRSLWGLVSSERGVWDAGAVELIVSRWRGGGDGEWRVEGKSCRTPLSR